MSCARRTWNDADRMSLRRLWDLRPPAEIAAAMERWRRVHRCRTAAEREAEVAKIEGEVPGWKYDPADGLSCCYETGSGGKGCPPEQAEKLREAAQRRLAALLGPERYQGRATNCPPGRNESASPPAAQNQGGGDEEGDMKGGAARVQKVSF